MFSEFLSILTRTKPIKRQTFKQAHRYTDIKTNNTQRKMYDRQTDNRELERETVVRKKVPLRIKGEVDK